jgi:hypothetical protein
MEEINHQHKFFTTLKANYEGNLSEKIAQLLGIKKSAAYNKLNGTSALGFDEIIRIGLALDISVDNIIYNNPIDKAPFTFISDSLKSEPNSYLEFLEFTAFQLYRIQDIKNLSLTYVTPHEPIVLLLQFPYLLSFKMFMWDITNWQIHDLYDESLITFHAQNETFIKEASKFYNTYIKFKTCEIISSTIFDTTFQQLKYCINKGYLKNPLLFDRIITDIQDLLLYINKICINDTKYVIDKPQEYTKNFSVYLNDIANQNELIFAEGHDLEVAISSFDTPSYLRSTDHRVTSYLGKTIERIKKHSILLSGKKGKSEIQKWTNSQSKKIDDWNKTLLKMMK